MDIFIPAKLADAQLIPTDSTKGRHDFAPGISLTFEIEFFCGDQTRLAHELGRVCVRAALDHLLPRIVQDFSAPISDGPTSVATVSHAFDDPSQSFQAVLTLKFDQNPTVARETSLAVLGPLARALKEYGGGESRIRHRSKKIHNMPMLPPEGRCCPFCRRWFLRVGKPSAQPLKGVCDHEGEARVEVPGGR